MISPRLLALIRCPDCGGALGGGQPELTCAACHRRFAASADYLVLHPGVSYAEQTKYLDEALHTDARQDHVSPPLLSAKIRNDVLRQFLAPGPADTVIDLGCGSGKAMVWNADLGAHQVGIDVSPYFAQEAQASVDLVLGDLRQLPFAPGAFTKGYALDVFEHVSHDALVEVLHEAARVLAPGGALFVYSHVRKNSRLAAGLKVVNALARWIERRGWMDLSRERLRKSDHLNPLTDIPDLEAVVASAGFRIARIRYYTPAVGAVVENIFMRMAEHWLSRRAARRARSAGMAIGTAEAARQARSAAKATVDARGLSYLALRAATWAMKLDILLFGRVRSGPFFALLVKDAAPGKDRRA
ncbi:MAG: methyltransferase domain-containing protein [Acidobacteriota bacterium]